jgi:hypothetical protein
MLVSVKAITSPFLSIIERNFSSELFFDGLLSDEDLSKLLCTCRVMKEMILKWKNIFPIKQINIKSEIMTNEMLVNLINHYSSNIIKLIVPDGYGLIDSIASSSLHSNLLYLKLDIKDGISNDEQFYSRLAQLINLEHLFLTGNSYSNYELTNERLSNLSTLVSLSHLTIDEFILSIRNLFHLSSVVILIIQNCVIFPEGSMYDVEYPFLENLKHLSLIDNTTSEDNFDAELLFQLPKKLTHLSIVQNEEEYPCLDDQMLMKIFSLFYLKHYNYKHSAHYGYNNSDAGLSYLCSLSNLVYIRVTEPMHDEDLFFLKCLSNLTHLRLGVNSAISNIGLSHLSSLQKLTYLSLGRKSSINDIGLSYISSHTKLTYLALGRKSYITDQGISHLSSCVNLTNLYLGEKSKISYQGISMLTSLTILSDISILLFQSF